MQQTDLRFSYQVVVGDSWVLSYGNDGEAWPGLLEQELGLGRVMNLGLSGFAPGSTPGSTRPSGSRSDPR